MALRRHQRHATLAVLLAAHCAVGFFWGPTARVVGAPPTRRRHVVAPLGAGAPPEELPLTEENVEFALGAARTELGALFGYDAENRAVGITGTVDLVELNGPNVVVRLGGRFWHERRTVLARVEKFLQGYIPELCEVEIEDPAQLRDDDPPREVAAPF